MNVAIIGCGYVGSAVAKYWQQKMTLIVTATTTTPERVQELNNIAQKVFVVRANNPEGILPVIEHQDCLLISVAGGRKASYQETYLDTAKTISSLIKKTQVKQIIYTSACSVYGDLGGQVVDEDTPVNPSQDNYQILAETEQVLLSQSSSNLKVCVLRLGGIYGPGRELLKIYSRAAGQTRPGEGKEPANWIHLDDIVGAIEFARHYHLDGVYNLVDDAGLTNREVIERVCQTHNLDPVIWDSSQPSTRNYNARINNAKIKAAGYKFIRPAMEF